MAAYSSAIAPLAPAMTNNIEKSAISASSEVASTNRQDSPTLQG
uniref:Uncharacterized protein n=1 Tax=uncultured bacterium B26B6 TaxID=1329636 RepID=S4W2Z4_9BACT|nr:hypothetical protein [uncultured bacterium B26B6]